jgi:hypothetical protein
MSSSVNNTPVRNFQSPFYLSPTNQNGYVTPVAIYQDLPNEPPAIRRMLNAETYIPLENSLERFDDVRRDLFGANSSCLVLYSKIFSNIISAWQFLPVFTDYLVKEIRQEHLAKWNWVFVIPLNTCSNVASFFLTPLIASINAIALTFFLVKNQFVRDEENQRGIKFSFKAVQISLVLGFVNLSKALYPGISILDIYNHYKESLGLNTLIEDL